MSGTRRSASVTIPVRTEGTQAAQRDLQRLGQTGDQALRQITLSAGLAQRALGLLGPVLAGLSVGALAVFTRNAINAAGAIGEVAEQIGVTTDALQVLRFGAVQSGISMEELERALATLTRTIADAEQGSGEAAERFNRFGIAFRDANGNIRASEAILGDVSDAMSRLESPTERAALATSIFGDRLGQRLIPLLVGGRDALGEFERQARATGQVLDQDTVRAARAAADNMAALQATFETFTRNLAVNVVPVLQQVLGLINRLVFGAPVAQQAAERRASLAVLEGRIAELQSERDAPLPGLPNLGRAAQNRAEMLRAGRQQAIDQGIRELQAERAGLVLELDRLARQEQEQRARAAETFGDRPTGRDVSFLPMPPPATPETLVTASRGGGGGARSGLDVAAIQQRLENDRLNRDLQDRARIIQANITPLDQYNERMARLQAVVARFAETPNALDGLTIEREKIAAAEDYERALNRVQSSLDRFAAEGADVFSSIADASARAMKGIEDAIITAAQTGRLEWRGLVNSILADLARIAIRQNITGPLASALSSALSGAFGGAGEGGGGASVSARAMGGPVFAGRAYRVGEFGPETFVPNTGGRIVPGGGVPAKAMGGPVFADRAYRVGEFGPETFVPNTGGRIVPGGGGVTVNLSIGVGVAQTVAAEIRNLLPAITQAVEAGVADRTQRGGGYAAAVRGR
jgi:lambda family phage tail tape measure protein/TP901 family phage tail tape measure protein